MQNPQPLGSLDPFAQQAPTRQRNALDDLLDSPTGCDQNTAAMANMNLDPFNNVPMPAEKELHNQSLDPFAAKAETNATQNCGDFLDPYAAPAQAAVPQVMEPEQTLSSFSGARDDEICDLDDLEGMDELDRAEAMAARLAQAEGVEYEEDSDEDGLDDADDADDAAYSDRDRWSEGPGSEEYDAEFGENDYKLGVLIADVKAYGAQRVMAKMVVDHSSAMREGITEGSTLVAVNGTDVRGLMKDDCTKLMKDSRGCPKRPLTLRFRKPDGRDGSMAKGEILARVLAGEATGSGGFGFVGNWKRGVAQWSDRYYVWAGQDDQLVVYRSEQDYQQHTVQSHEVRKGLIPKVTIKCDTFNLAKIPLHAQPYKVGHIKCKEYKSYGQLFYFSLKCKPDQVAPVWMVAAKFASRDKLTVDRLHESLRHVIRQNMNPVKAKLFKVN